MVDTSSSRGFFNLSLRAFLFALPLVIASDMPSTTGWMFVVCTGITASLLLFSLLLPPQKALLVILVTALAGRDINLGGYETDIEIASVWANYIGPLKPSWIIFTIVFLQILRLKKLFVPRVVSWAIVWFASVPFLAGLFYGGLTGPHAGIQAIVDFKVPMMLLSSLVLYLSVIKRHPDFPFALIAVLMGGLFARHFADLIYVAYNVGPEITEGISRGSLDSAKGAVVLLLLFSTLLVFVHKRFLYGTALTLAFAALLVSYGTRMLWITTLIGSLVLLFSFSLQRRMLLAGLVVVLAIAGAWGSVVLNPESARVAYLRFQTITEGRPISKFSVDVAPNLFSRIDPTRYGQFLNLMETSTRRGSVLWGLGYGGYYEDRAVPMHYDVGSAFPEYSYETGYFYRAHFFPAHIFLKYGLVGLWIIGAMWVVPGWYLFTFFRGTNYASGRKTPVPLSVMRCLMAFLATSMFQLYWSGKGLFISGVILALCIDFSIRHCGMKASSRILKRQAKLNPLASLRAT